MKQHIYLFVAMLAICMATGCRKEKSVTAQMVTITPSEISLTKGEEAKLSAEIKPENTTDKSLLWISDNTDIVSVDANGTVKALSVGNAMITAFVGEVKGTCKVTVTGKDVESLSLDKQTLELTKGEQYTFTATITPEDAEDKSIRWSSSDESIVSVDSQGQVTAIAKGQATVTAHAGGCTAQCSVTVLPPEPESISLNYTEYTLLAGESFELIVSVNPEDAQYDNIEWESSDNSIATVDNGKVTAVATGNATVTARISDISTQCKINVMREPVAGDYYYSDGTYSENLQTDKKLIGIVYWTGDPTLTDAALKKDFPGCTHGLVCAAVGDGMGVWQSNSEEHPVSVSEWAKENASEYADIATGYELEDNLNIIMGYSNTRVMLSFNADPSNSEWMLEAAKRVTDFSSTHPASPNSSGWYIPSAKELSLMFTGEYSGNIYEIAGDNTNMKMLNAKLKGIEGANEINNNNYWTSTEYDAQTAFYIQSASGMVDNCEKSLSRLMRYILAF